MLEEWLITRDNLKAIGDYLSGTERPTDPDPHVDYRVLDALVETWAAMLRAYTPLSGVRVPVYALTGRQQEWIKKALDPGMPHTLRSTAEKRDQDFSKALGEYVVTQIKLAPNGKAEVQVTPARANEVLLVDIAKSPAIGQIFYLVPGY